MLNKTFSGHTHFFPTPKIIHTLWGKHDMIMRITKGFVLIIHLLLFHAFETTIDALQLVLEVEHFSLFFPWKHCIFLHFYSLLDAYLH